MYNGGNFTQESYYGNVNLTPTKKRADKRPMITGLNKFVDGR